MHCCHNLLGVTLGVLNLGGSWRFFEVKEDNWSIVIATSLSGLEVLKGVIRVSMLT